MLVEYDGQEEEEVELENEDDPISDLDSEHAKELEQPSDQLKHQMYPCYSCNGLVA